MKLRLELFYFTREISITVSSKLGRSALLLTVNRAVFPVEGNFDVNSVDTRIDR